MKTYVKHIVAMTALSLVLPSASADVTRKEIERIVRSDAARVKPKPGPRGERGPKGVQGLKGTQGPVGLVGHRGLSGDGGLTGASGPAGPPGLNGQHEFLFAHIFNDGTVEEGTARGITQANVRREDNLLDEERGDIRVVYCLSGLPGRRMLGGQIVIEQVSNHGTRAPLTTMLGLHVNSGIPNCPINIVMFDSSEQGNIGSFYLTLYR